MVYRRKSDIENERLPPDLYDIESEEGQALIANSLPTTPSQDSDPVPVTPNGITAGIQTAIAEGAIPASSLTSPSQVQTTTGSPLSPASPATTPSRRGHSRQASLGTTMTSPSTRRRSMESTINMIQGVWDGEKQRIPEQNEEIAANGASAG